MISRGPYAIDATPERRPEENQAARNRPAFDCVACCVEIKFRAPHAIDATCFRSCVCAMAWRFHAIDATLSPWPRRLDGVEAHEG